MKLDHINKSHINLHLTDISESLRDCVYKVEHSDPIIQLKVITFLEHI